MAGNLGTKIIAIYLMIDIFLFMGGMVDTTDSWLYQDFVTVNGTDPLEDSTITANEDMDTMMGLDTNATGGVEPGIGIKLYNGIVLVWNSLLLLASLFFAPVFVLQKVGAPFGIVLVGGVVPLAILIFTVLSFVRGKDF